ncbi:Beta-galactosidase C-terminal domain [Paenibacillus flagellatus]|uniref:Beta-galactosidase C-terminal domain n=1 Tax=Paenibacillus flagellatus TaxID=2211139 RepID=UPI001FE3551F|nr:Beta-galactosidase C-terminal domain [Paenibacillus flagellatus]
MSRKTAAAATKSSCSDRCQTAPKGNGLLDRLIDHYAGEADVRLRTDATKGTIVAPRRGDGGDVWVVVNMDGAGGSVTVPRDGYDALTNVRIPAGRLDVGRYEYRIVRFYG